MKKFSEKLNFLEVKRANKLLTRFARIRKGAYLDTIKPFSFWTALNPRSLWRADRKFKLNQRLQVWESC